MALEDIKRNAKRVIESDIKEYLNGHKNQSGYNYIFSKIDLAKSAALLTIAETDAYLEQLRNDQ